jgi:hypothetical protein
MSVRPKRLRVVRRLRILRQRHVRPTLRALASRLAAQWSAPARLSVAAQLRRLAAAVDASLAVGSRMAAAEERLGRELSRLEQLGDAPRDGSRARADARADWEVASPWGAGRVAGAARGGVHSGGGGGGRGAVVPGSPWVALLLGLTALGLVAGNGWLLDRYLIPPVLDAGVLRLLVAPGPWLAIPFSMLALVLGLFHFALFTAGRSAPLRLLGVGAMLLLVGLGAAQAAATVVAVEAWTGAATASWAGVAALVLLAGAAGLVPPVIGATAHAAMDRLARWSAVRELRSAGRAGRARAGVVRRMEKALQEVAAGMAGLRAEAAAVPEGDVARLLVRPDPAPSVDRLVLVLQRLAVSVERDRVGWQPPPGDAGLRYLGDTAVLLVWILAASATLLLGAPAAGALGAEALATGAGAPAGLTGPAWSGAIPGLAALACLLALLVSGLALRLLLRRPGRRLDHRVSGAAILLLGITVASMAMALGGAASAQQPQRYDPLGAAALLNVTLLVAAVASVRLPEAVRSVAALLHMTVTALAWAALALVDVALALADLALTGRRPPRRSRARSSTIRPPPLPAVEALGSGPDRR